MPDFILEFIGRWGEDSSSPVDFSQPGRFAAQGISNGLCVDAFLGHFPNIDDWSATTGSAQPKQPMAQVSRDACRGAMKSLPSRARRSHYCYHGVEGAISRRLRYRIRLDDGATDKEAARYSSLGRGYGDNAMWPHTER